MDKDVIAEEDLEVLQTLKGQKDKTIKNAEIARLQHRLAEQAYENTVLKIYLKYGLDSKDTFDEANGVITRVNGEDDDESTETESPEGTL